jgi:uncharacterized membrane protein YjgN (DUF898 family)
VEGHIDRETPAKLEDSAFEFTGNWAAFGKIALTNILLSVVTLGLYRFWATTRERQYLWSETRFIDDRLEWTGTGKELFIGFLLVLVLIFGPFFALNFASQALIMRGEGGLGGALYMLSLILIFYLGGVARFRGLRYRLSRTYWHGIRGGSNNPGFIYGWSYMWKTFVGYIVFGLMIPWSMMSLWNERWSQMSFGPHKFDAVGDYSDTFKRYLLFYLSPLLFFVGGIVLAIVGAGAGAATGADSETMGMLAGVGAVGGMVLFFYVGLGLIALFFYAKFFRVAIDGLSLQKLDFGFSAKTKHWFMLILGDAGLWLLAALFVALPIGVAAASIGLIGDFEMPDPNATSVEAYLAFLVPMIFVIIIPFALVGPFIRYRHWKFFITYMQCYGEINLDELTQSETESSKHGEGLLDAFDVGAI